MPCVCTYHARDGVDAAERCAGTDCGEVGEQHGGGGERQ